MSIVLLGARTVCQSDLGDAKILSIAREIVFATLSHRAQGSKRIIFCLSTALMIDTIRRWHLIPQKQNDSWAAVVGITVALVGAAVAIVSTSWLSRNQVPLDLEREQALDPLKQT